MIRLPFGRDLRTFEVFTSPIRRKFEPGSSNRVEIDLAEEVLQSARSGR